MFVVLGMRANPLDQDQAVLVLGLDDQSIGVALDVEDDLVVCQEAGAGLPDLDVLWTGPLGSLGLKAPSIKRPTCVSMFALEVVQLDEAK